MTIEPRCLCTAVPLQLASMPSSAIEARLLKGCDFQACFGQLPFVRQSPLTISQRLEFGKRLVICVATMFSFRSIPIHNVAIGSRSDDGSLE